LIVPRKWSSDAHSRVSKSGAFCLSIKEICQEQCKDTEENAMFHTVKFATKVKHFSLKLIPLNELFVEKSVLRTFEWAIDVIHIPI
jgi:hypothetical protein